MILVDLEPAAVEDAARRLAPPDARALTADLSEPGDLQRIGEALASSDAAPVVTCFEVLEHLATFVPLLEWARELASSQAATVVLSVPNDAFWSIQNPHHQTQWSEGAFDELRQLLPAEHTLLRQVALAGSAVVGWDAAPERYELGVEPGGEGTIATHFVAAFGPRHEQLERVAFVVQTEMLEQRRWERERESNVATAQRLAAERQTKLLEYEHTIIKLRQEFVAWRAYIHELEHELGRPLSGVAEEDGASSAQPAPESVPEPPA
jgi:hypothetical protein